MDVILFSNQFSEPTGHGIARYARELFRSLTSDLGINVRPFSTWTSMKEPDRSAYIAQTQLVLSPLGRRLTPLSWATLGMPRIETLAGWRPDVVHAASLGFPVPTKSALVVTVHDLGPLTQPQFFRNTRPGIMKLALRHSARHADIFLAVSQSTANELTDVCPEIRPDRIRVIPEGVSEEFFLDPESFAPPTKEKFILCTGKVSPRKNIAGVIGALERVKDKIPHHLILVGGNGWDHEELFRGLEVSAIRDRIHQLGYVSDSDLRSLYKQASLYVHPSFYEGFGLTVLEAMAAGCPVLTSNTTSLPEVVGDAAVTVPPDDVDQIADALVDLCQNESRQNQFRLRGIERASQFTWRKCAEEVARCYEFVGS